MKKLYLLSITVCFFLIKVYAQKQGQEKIDSLLIALQQANEDTNMVKIYNSLAGQYFRIGNYNIALDQSEKALQLAQRIQFQNGEAAAYSFKGIIFDVQENLPESLKNHLASLKVNEQIGNKDGIASSFLNVGIIYGKLKDYNKALEYFAKAQKIFEENNKQQRLASVYGNIGSVYIQQSKFDDALNSFEKSLNIYKESGDKSAISRPYHNIAKVYEHQKNYTEALKNYQTSLQLSEESGYKQGIAINLMSIGDVYRLQGKPNDAKNWIQKSLALSKEIGSLEFIKNAYSSLAIIDSTIGNYQSAFENYKLYTTYKDSIFNEENTKKLTQVEMNYEFEKTQDSIQIANDKEIAIRDATLQSNRREKWALTGGLLVLSIFGTLLYRQSKIRKQNNQQLQILNTELDNANKTKTRFFSILNHDLRSPVSNLIHFLHLKNDTESLDEESQSRLEQKTMNSAENLLSSMEDLLLWSKGQMENFKPQATHITVQKIFEDNTRYFSDTEHIDFQYHNPQNILLLIDENYLKTIIRNLTSNAINIFSSTSNPTIIWNAYTEADKTVLSITDNGPGSDSKKFRALYDDKEVVGIKSGLGLHLIRDLAKAIDCKVIVENNPKGGTIISLIL